MEKKYILVINAGSSSIKMKLFEHDNLSVVLSGICERIKVDGYFKINFILNDKNQTVEHKADFPNHEIAINHFFDELKKNKIINSTDQIIGAGHRIVQGGNLEDSKFIDSDVLKDIEDKIVLAPLHNEPELAVIKIIQENFRHIQNVAVFDTAFHTTIPKIHSYYSVPSEWVKNHGVKKYGFHGTSYKFILEKTKLILKTKKKLNLIVCHLGNGASVCCIKDDKSFDTTMGLTPNAGLVMGTRCGDIDASVVEYISKVENLDVATIQKKLNNESGVKSICGASDFRDISANIKEGNDYEFAYDIFCQKVSNYIALYSNHLENKIDGIIFTGGIGENVSKVREKIINKVFNKDLKLDKSKNLKKYEDFNIISKSDSKIKILAVRTDEELLIAKDTKRLMK